MCSAKFSSLSLTKRILVDSVFFAARAFLSSFSQPRPLRVFDIFRKRLLGRLTASLSVPMGCVRKKSVLYLLLHISTEGSGSFVMQHKQF